MVFQVRKKVFFRHAGRVLGVLGVLGGVLGVLNALGGLLGGVLPAGGELPWLKAKLCSTGGQPGRRGMRNGGTAGAPSLRPIPASPPASRPADCWTAGGRPFLLLAALPTAPPASQSMSLPLIIIIPIISCSALLCVLPWCCPQAVEATQFARLTKFVLIQNEARVAAVGVVYRCEAWGGGLAGAGQIVAGKFRWGRAQAPGAKAAWGKCRLFSLIPPSPKAGAVLSVQGCRAGG